MGEMVYPTPSQSMKVMLSHTPSSVWTWLDVSSSPTTSRSSPREVTLSPPPPNVKSSVTSRKSSAMLPLTSNKKWPPQLPPPPWRNPTNCPMDKSSPLATNVSVPQKPPSNRCGSPSKNTTNAAHPLSTENASKLYIFYYYIVFNLLFMLFDPNFIFIFYSNIPNMNKLYIT